MMVSRDLPDSLVADLDFYCPGPPGSDPFLVWAELRGAAPIVWTPRNGGHWIATRGETIRAILLDHTLFSSRSAFIPRMDRPRAVPLEYDPPEHAKLRRMLVPFFSPRALAGWTEQARELAVRLIDDLAGQGGCEFMADFARQLPITIFLRMMDLPDDDRPQLLDNIENALRPTSEAGRLAARGRMNRYIAELVRRRRDRPGEDLLSQALQTDLGGRRMTDDEAFGLASGLLGGGLDTVAASMGWAVLFLAENPSHRRQLIEAPGLIPNAVNELLRRFSVPNIGRIVTADTEYGGAPLRTGDAILLPACLHGLDDSCFDDAMTVDFRRANAVFHSTFSHGIHRCVGAALALAELRIFLEAWLARIPDFGLVAGDPPVRATGIVHGLTRLPLRWPA